MKPSVVYPENLIGVLKPHLKAWCSETWSASLVKHLSFFLSFFFRRSSVPIQRIGESSSYFVIILRKLMDSQKLQGCTFHWEPTDAAPHQNLQPRDKTQASKRIPYFQSGGKPGRRSSSLQTPKPRGERNVRPASGGKKWPKGCVFFLGCIYLYTFVRMCKLNKSPLFLLQNIGICSVFKRGRGVTATATPTKFLSKIGKS